MGYRSDVTIVMYPKKEEDYAMLKLFVDENLPDKFEEHWCQQAEVFRKYLVLELEGTKWYGDYPEVVVYSNTFNNWDEWFKDKNEPDTPLFHFEFVRIGENYEDITHETSAGADEILTIKREARIEI